MRDYFAEEKRWNLLDKMNKRIFETVEVEDGQLRILIDFFCYDVIVNEMMGNIEDTIWRYYYEDVNGSSIKEILEEELTDLGVILKEILINIKNKSDRLYWGCVFGNGIEGLQENVYHIRKCIIEEMTANNFYMDLEVMYGTLNEIIYSLETIEMNNESR